MNVNEFFALGDVINFSVYPSAVLGSNFNRVKVLSVLDPATAKLFADVVALHNNIYPYLTDPDKVTYKKYTDYNYIKVRLSNGTETVLGLPWINMETVVVVTSTTARFDIALDTPDEINDILALLRANGWYNVAVTTL